MKLKKGECAITLRHIDIEKLSENHQIYVLKYFPNTLAFGGDYLAIGDNYTNAYKIAEFTKYGKVIQNIWENDFTNSGLAKNVFATEEILKKFASNRSKYIRAFVVKNPSTPLETLETLSFDNEIEVLIAFSYSPNATSQMLKRALMNNRINFGYEISLNEYDGILKNKNTPAELIQKIYNQIGNSYIHRNTLLLAHPNTPISVKNAITKKDSRCFIATAVFESSETKEVLFFREFRDQKLLTSIHGKFFVKTYYYLSPNLANMITRNKRVKTVIKKFIFIPLYNRLKKKTVYNNVYKK